MNYIFCDTEGSGLFDYHKPADAIGQPRMAAIGMILTNDDLEIEAEYAFLIKPEDWVFDNETEAAKVNGLTHERLLAEGVDLKEPLRLYGDAIDQRRIVVGFNVIHDLKMLRGELRSVGFPDRYMQTRHICAMQGCRRIVDARTADGRKKAPRLEEACAHFQIERHGAHTGIGDAHDVLAIMRKLRELGEMPAYTDPYDRGPKKIAPTPQARPQGREYERQVIAAQRSFINTDNEDEALQDFIGGASEDGK